MPITIHNRSVQFANKVTTAAARALLAVADEVANAHVEDLSRKIYPPASRPGQYAAKRTGNLANSVRARPRTIETIKRGRTVAVGYLKRAFYGDILVEKMDRKGPADTYRRIKNRLPGKFKGTWIREYSTM